MFYLYGPSELALTSSDPPPTFDDDYALPMFFVMIFAEWIVKTLTSPRSRPTNAYRVNDFLSSVFLGASQSLFTLLLALVGLSLEVGMYTMVYEKYRLFEVDASARPYLTYVALLLGKDLAYYCAHRFFHEYHVAWIGHSVHHSGEDYNLGTALRQGALQPVFGWPFYVPLALCGFHPHAFRAHAQLNTFFMFWIHTDLIGRMPFGLEYIINTPSSHRMHHRPPGNCNYAGALIVWDRLFDTYVPERVRKEAYGNGRQPNTFDTISVNAHHCKSIRDIPGTWWSKICRRRVRKPRRVRPAGLWERIPPLSSRPPVPLGKRKKWDGSRHLNIVHRVFYGLTGLTSLIGAVGLLLARSTTDDGDVAACALASCLLFSELGKFADGSVNRWWIVLCGLATQYSILLFHPMETLDLGVDARVVAAGSVAALIALGARSI